MKHDVLRAGEVKFLKRARADSADHADVNKEEFTSIEVIGF